MFAWRRWVKRWAPKIPQPMNCMQKPDKGSMTMQPVPLLNLGPRAPSPQEYRPKNRDRDADGAAAIRRSLRRWMEGLGGIGKMFIACSLDRDAFDLSQMTGRNRLTMS